MCAACGGWLTLPRGVITSPNYPANYDHNDNCAWMISAPPGYRIRVRTFRVFFTTLTMTVMTRGGGGGVGGGGGGGGGA